MCGIISSESDVPDGDKYELLGASDLGSLLPGSSRRLAWLFALFFSGFTVKNFHERLRCSGLQRIYYIQHDPVRWESCLHLPRLPVRYFCTAKLEASSLLPSLYKFLSTADPAAEAPDEDSDAPADCMLA